MADTATLLLVPAPAELRQGLGADWVKVRSSRPDKVMTIAAHDDLANEVAKTETTWLGPGSARMTISLNTTTVVIEFSVGKDDEGAAFIRGLINEQEFEISAMPGRPDQVRTKTQIELDPVTSEALSAWGPLAESMFPLARAALVNVDEPRNSWSCTPCLLGAAGTGLAAGMCLTGALAGCATALLGAATVAENCGGAADPCG